MSRAPPRTRKTIGATRSRTQNPADVHADTRARPSSTSGGVDVGRLQIDDRRRHLVARQGRGRRSEHHRFRRDIAKSASPPCAAPVAGAFQHFDFRALGDALHDAGLAGRPDPHRNRRAGHRQFRDRRRNKGDGNAKPKTKTRNHSAAHTFRSSAKIVASTLMVHSRDAPHRVFIALSLATSGLSARRPVRCENCPQPSSFQAAKPRRA